MGVTISELSQVVPDGTPSLADLGGPPDIAIIGAGSKRRHRFFLRSFEDLPDVKVLRCPGQADPEAREGTLAQSLIEAAARAPKADANRLKLFVDVSCLSRPAMAQVFATLPLIAQNRNVDLRVGYSLAAYAPSPAIWATPNRTICPVHPAFSGWTSEGASAPLDIVVGLGYEKGKALGAVEYLEPRHRWICVPTSPEKAYLDEVEKHNKNLIDNSKDRVLLQVCLRDPLGLKQLALGGPVEEVVQVAAGAGAALCCAAAHLKNLQVALDGQLQAKFGGLTHGCGFSGGDGSRIHWRVQSRG